MFAGSWKDQWRALSALAGVAAVLYVGEQMRAGRALLQKSAAEAVSVCWVTTPKESTDKLARGLVEGKLAACVNVIPQIKSVYTWEGKIEQDTEDLLMIKTRTELVDLVTTWVEANHPYDTPEVISVKLDAGSKGYLDFVRDSTIPSPGLQ